MNIREYIASGIVESFVLGLASPEESAEFEKLCAAHDEVQQARIAFEKQLEEALHLQKIPPPREIKSSIFSRIGMEEVDQPPVTRLDKPAMVQRKGFPRLVAAASVILLLGSVSLNLYLLNQYKHSIALYKALAADQNRLTGTNQLLNTKLENYGAALEHIKDPKMEIVKLPSAPASPDPSSMATVYWNTDSKEVYLLVNQLPIPASGMQYQLWAMVDGRPTDAGTFDMEIGTAFMKLKTIPRAQAFAITLEKKGGSETPDMNALYVMGKVTG